MNNLIQRSKGIFAKYGGVVCKFILKKKEPMNEFRLAEFIYDFCRCVGVSAGATAKMILIKIDTEQKEIEGE